MLTLLLHHLDVKHPVTQWQEENGSWEIPSYSSKSNLCSDWSVWSHLCWFQFKLSALYCVVLCFMFIVTYYLSNIELQDVSKKMFSCQVSVAKRYQVNSANVNKNESLFMFHNSNWVDPSSCELTSGFPTFDAVPSSRPKLQTVCWFQRTTHLLRWACEENWTVWNVNIISISLPPTEWNKNNWTLCVTVAYWTLIQPCSFSEFNLKRTVWVLLSSIYYF